MKCYVINLKRAVERKQYISKQLNQVSQNFEFVEGIDWKDYVPKYKQKTVRNFKIRNSFRSLSVGEIGCNLSHRKILKWLANSSEELITILEDDVRLSKNFSDVLQELENRPCKFDIVFLGSSFQKKQLVNISPLNDEFYFSLSKSRESGAWGYVITNEAAKKFLEIFPEVTGPIDDALHSFHVHGLKTYILNPQIVFHDEEAIKYSFSREKKRDKKFKEEVIRFVLKSYERYTYKNHFGKRRQNEQINPNPIS